MSARSLDVEVSGGRVRPRYLGARDRPWVSAVLAAVDRQEGRRAARAHRAIIGAASGIGRHYEVAPEAVSLLLAIEKERVLLDVGWARLRQQGVSFPLRHLNGGIVRTVVKCEDDAALVIIGKRGASAAFAT